MTGERFDKLMRTTFAAPAQAASGLAEYDLDGGAPRVMLRPGEWVPRHVVHYALLRDYDDAFASGAPARLHRAIEAIRRHHAGDIVTDAAKSVDDGLRRAAAESAERLRYPPGGHVLSDPHSHQARIANVPLDLAGFAERIRVAVARAVAADELMDIATQRALAERVIAEIARELLPSRAANDALMGRPRGS